jgi:hypothetical protein
MRVCRANGAVSLALAWGNAPGFHSRKKKALKARLNFFSASLCSLSAIETRLQR